MARRRIRVAEFRGENAEIEFSNGSVYPIRGDLPVEVIVYMAELEEEASAEDEASEGIEWIRKGQQLLLDLVRELTPDAEIPMMSPQEILGTLASIAGGETVGSAVAAAINAGIDELAPSGSTGPELEETDEGGGPLVAEETEPETSASRSARPSSGRSSRSRSRTGGTRRGGEPDSPVSAPSPGRKPSSSSSSETKSEAA